MELGGVERRLNLNEKFIGKTILGIIKSQLKLKQN